MKRKKRKNGPQKNRTCDHCRRKFVVANATIRVQTCPHCGKESSAARTKGWWERYADRLFARLIRDRDTDENGMACCCTCDQRIPAELGDAGHWYPRGWKAVRYDEENVHFQCRSCNRPMESWNRSRAKEMMDKHRQFVFNHHGQSAVERIEAIVEHEKRGQFREMNLVEIREFATGLAANCRAHGLPDD